METYLAYFDETGDDGINPSSSDTFVLTSLYMPSNKWQNNYDEFKTFREEIKNKYGLHVIEEMHTMDFLRDKNPYRNNQWTIAQRQGILLEFAKEISHLEIQVINVIIDKNAIQQKDYPILENALTYNIQRIENDSKGKWNYIIISDKGRIAPMRKTARKIRKYNFVPSHYSEGSNQPIKNLIEDILEKDSKESYFIQICDFISSFVYLFHKYVANNIALPKRINYLINHEFITIIMKMFKENGILNLKASPKNEYGFVIYPKS